MDQGYLNVVDEKAQLLEDTANYLWDNPETAFTEYKAAAYLCDILRRVGPKGYEAPIPKAVKPRAINAISR